MTTTIEPKSLPIFGPPRAWKQDDFTASDDRVRGGSSQSYLTPSATLMTARFHGVLDTTTLGGAGFASQRTTATTKVWNLSCYDGIGIDIAMGDGKKYTLNIKNVLPDKMDNGRDASTVEYAYSFTAPEHSQKIFIAWDKFQSIYRGRPAKDAKPLDTSNILRWSIMMRSFFEEQSGPFSLTLRSIKAIRKSSGLSEKALDDEDTDWDDCNAEDEQVFDKMMSLSKGDAPSRRFCSIL